VTAEGAWGWWRERRLPAWIDIAAAGRSAEVRATLPLSSQ